jgi:formyl-CoA transferase
MLERMLARADIFVQNLKPGAIAKLGFAIPRLRRDYPRLITCSITGYGESGPFAKRKAYDMLIQAEAGLAHVTGGPEAPSRVGVSIVDVTTGTNAYQAVLEALLLRHRTGEGSALSVSMFDAVADLMTVPLLQHEGGASPKRIGLNHPSISPYGVFMSRDGVEVLISIQNDREWVVLAREVLGDAVLAADPRFATNEARLSRRAETDGRVAADFASMDVETLTAKLNAADIAYGRVSDIPALAAHPHLRRTTVGSPTGPISYPAPAARFAGETRTYGPIPALGEDTARVRAEFAE